MSLKGPSVAYMKGQYGTVADLLAKKRLVLGWSNYYFVFFPKNRRLYQYRSELVCCILMRERLLRGGSFELRPRVHNGSATLAGSEVTSFA